MAKAKYVYFNDEIVPWDAAKIHIFAPVAKYGIGVLEGIRGYWEFRHAGDVSFPAGGAHGQAHLFADGHAFRWHHRTDEL